MERKLVSIQRIRKIHPITGADNIECVTINGWECVAKKGEFKEDDLCVYFEIDSFLPEEERYAFLRDVKNHQDKKGYRIKTIKLRGQISQGLALPLSTFPEIKNPVEMQEVTELLKVFKYDNSVGKTGSIGGVKTGRSEGKFPSFISKTDQERIQTLVAWFERYKDEEWEETLKLDGSSMTCYKILRKANLWDKVKLFFGFKVNLEKFGVCSRNVELKRTDNFTQVFDNDGKLSEYNQSNFWQMAIKYNIEKLLPVGYALQGELIGPKIQANHEKVLDLDFYVFDIFDIEQQQYLAPEERKEMMTRLKEIKHVPVISRSVKIFEECPTLNELLARVKGESMNKGTISEGRVYKSKDGSKSFKCINNDYLLKCEE